MKTDRSDEFLTNRDDTEDAVVVAVRASRARGGRGGGATYRGGRGCLWGGSLGRGRNIHSAVASLLGATQNGATGVGLLGDGTARCTGGSPGSARGAGAARRAWGTRGSGGTGRSGGTRRTGRTGRIGRTGAAGRTRRTGAARGTRGNRATRRTGCGAAGVTRATGRVRITGAARRTGATRATGAAGGPGGTGGRAIEGARRVEVELAVGEVFHEEARPAVVFLGIVPGGSPEHRDVSHAVERGGSAHEIRRVADGQRGGAARGNGPVERGPNRCRADVEVGRGLARDHERDQGVVAGFGFLEVGGFFGEEHAFRGDAEIVEGAERGGGGKGNLARGVGLRRKV